MKFEYSNPQKMDPRPFTFDKMFSLNRIKNK